MRPRAALLVLVVAGALLIGCSSDDEPKPVKVVTGTFDDALKAPCKYASTAFLESTLKVELQAEPEDLACRFTTAEGKAPVTAALLSYAAGDQAEDFDVLLGQSEVGPSLDAGKGRLRTLWRPGRGVADTELLMETSDGLIGVTVGLDSDRQHARAEVIARMLIERLELRAPKAASPSEEEPTDEEEPPEAADGCRADLLEQLGKRSPEPLSAVPAGSGGACRYTTADGTFFVEVAPMQLGGADRSALDRLEPDTQTVGTEKRTGKKTELDIADGAVLLVPPDGHPAGETLVLLVGDDLWTVRVAVPADGDRRPVYEAVGAVLSQ